MCGRYTYKQGELRGRVGEDRRGKETDGCPLTLPLYLLPLAKLLGPIGMMLK
jgi:hypothetical protein